MNIDDQIEETTNKLKELKKEKEEIKKEKRRSNLDEEVINIAEILHEKLCTYNHTDGCGWFYGKWSDENLQYSKKEYYDKASELIKFVVNNFYIQINHQVDSNLLKNFIVGFLDQIN